MSLKNLFRMSALAITAVLACTACDVGDEEVGDDEELGEELGEAEQGMSPILDVTLNCDSGSYDAWYRYGVNGTHAPDIRVYGGGSFTYKQCIDENGIQLFTTASLGNGQASESCTFEYFHEEGEVNSHWHTLTCLGKFTAQ